MGRVAPRRLESLRNTMREAYDALDREPGPTKRADWSKASADYYLGLHPEDAIWRRTDPSDEIPSVDEIRVRSEVADRAHRAIPSGGRIDPRPGRRDAWSAQLGWAEETWREVFTNRFSAAESAVKGGDESGLEYCIRFLEADPWCFGSGYAKARLIPAIRKFELDEPTRERLRRVILAVVDDPRRRREIPRYGQLARAVDSTDLRAQLESRSGAVDLQVRYNANTVLKILG